MSRKRLCVRISVCIPPKISSAIFSSREVHYHHCVYCQPNSRLVYTSSLFCFDLIARSFSVCGSQRFMSDRRLTQRAVRGIPSLSSSSGSSMPSWTDSSLLWSAMMGKGRSPVRSPNAITSFTEAGETFTTFSKCFITSSWIFPKFRQVRFYKWHLIFNF